MIHRKNYELDCGNKCFYSQTPQVRATDLVNETSDINGLPHQGNEVMKMNRMS